jgi:hypothetical protein
MSKLASFGFIVLLFLLLSVVVVFGFFVFTPELKAYRALQIELAQKQKELKSEEKQFDLTYTKLQALQESEKNIDLALQRHFDEQQFERYLQRYFKDFSLRSITTELEDGFQIDVLEVQATITTPAKYYDFIEALNAFVWVTELEATQKFRGVGEGIEAHFTLKVYTQR